MRLVIKDVSTRNHVISPIRHPQFIPRKGEIINDYDGKARKVVAVLWYFERDDVVVVVK